MDRAMKRHIGNQAALLQIGIDQISTVANSIVRAIDDEREREGEQLGHVVLILCERLMAIAEDIEISSRRDAPAEEEAAA